MIIKDQKSYNETRLQNPQSCSWLVVRSKHGPQNPNQIQRHQEPTRRTNSQTSLPKRNFTRYEWNHSLNLFYISHFRFTVCTATMAKRAEEESGEERVTAKSWPIMNLTARTLSAVYSSVSSNPGRTSYVYQDPGKSVASDDRSGKRERPSPPGSSKEHYGRFWSSQKWKRGVAEHDRWGKPVSISWNTLQKVDFHREEPYLGGKAHSIRYGKMIHDRTGKLVSEYRQGNANSDYFVLGSDAAEFVKVKDKVRNRQKRTPNVAELDEAFNSIGNVHEYNVKCDDIHGREVLNCSMCCQESWRTHVGTIVRLWNQCLGQNFSVKYNFGNVRHWLGDETVISLQRIKVYVFSDSVLCLGKVLQHPESNEAWKNRVAGIRSVKLQRLWWYKWRGDWIRVEHLPRIHNVAALWQNQRSSELFRTNTRIFHRKNSIYVNV